MKKYVYFLFAAVILISVCAGCARQETASSEFMQSSSEVQSAPAVSSEPSSAVSSAPETASLSEPEPELSARERKWRGDLAYFKRHYVMYHPDPFYYVSEEELDWQLEQLAKKVPELSDNDIFFELSKIVAGFGDNHTSIHTPDDLYSEYFPIGIRYFGDKLYLTCYREKFAQFQPYLLHEIVSVNGVDMKYLQQKFESIVHSANAWRSKSIFQEAFFLPAFFDWAGCDYKDGYTIEILDDNQKVVSMELPVITQDADVGEKWIYPEGWEKILFLNQKYGWGKETLADVQFVETEQGNYIYLFIAGVMYSDEELYHGLMQKAGSLLAEHPGAKLVIDLRNDLGGWIDAVNAIKEDSLWLKETYMPQTYVIAGSGTESNGITLLSVIKRELNAVQVGEPTAAFTPSFCYYGTELEYTHTLPCSQLSFSVANYWCEGKYPDMALYDEEGKLYPWENTVLPDVYVSQDVEDIKAGKDSVIEWILEQ